jgi:hypothetical protein
MIELIGRGVLDPRMRGDDDCACVPITPRHCERSEAIHLSTCGAMHCFASLAMTLKGRSTRHRPSYGLADATLRFALQQSFREGILLTGNGNSAGLSVLVQLACKLRDLRSRAPRK